jgi:hypothetical protein
MSTNTSFIPIEGTFDIALARRAVRVRMAARRWAPTAYGRVSAALTALGELILLPSVLKAVIVKIDIFDLPESSGIELSCTLIQTEPDGGQMQVAQERLQRATDQLQIKLVANQTHICARLLISGGI